MAAVEPRTVGRYVLFGELASGGMATVHLGRLSGPVGFSRTVAVKRLHAQYAKDPEFVAMFLDEARLCGRIRHPCVVPTLDVVTEGPEVFLVMEYVQGEALSKLLKVAEARGEHIPARVSVAMVASILHGLHAAHNTKDEQGAALGIVHRDVSPQNVMIGADGVARVLDFGVAKASGRVQTTRDGKIKGKVAYMAPEQLSGAEVDARTDVYAAGVVLWELLTGRRLFDGETEALVLVRAMEGHVPPPSSVNPAVSSGIDEVIRRALARDPAHRFASAKEMAIALERSGTLASPSEIGEWVEHIAGDLLRSRAEQVAAVESAAAREVVSDPRVALAPREVPSQVSSISVSRTEAPPASRPAAKRSAGRAAAAGALAGLCLVGLAAGAIYVTMARQPVSRQEPRRVEHETHALNVASPPGATKAEPPAAPAPAAPVVRWTAPKPAAKPTKKPGCDPPYSVDPATGRKKYKLECMK
ncbi:MAG: serine/threonine-protein kinase [Polyangiaceae bacterium]